MYYPKNPTYHKKTAPDNLAYVIKQRLLEMKAFSWTMYYGYKRYLNRLCRVELKFLHHYFSGAKLLGNKLLQSVGINSVWQ